MYQKTADVIVTLLVLVCVLLLGVIVVGFSNNSEYPTRPRCVWEDANTIWQNSNVPMRRARYGKGYFYAQGHGLAYVPDNCLPEVDTPTAR